MSSFDFSSYDFEDTTPADSKIKSIPKKPVKKSSFDFDEYEFPEPRQEKSHFDTLKEYGKTALKGTAEGITKLGHIFGPTVDIHGRPLSEVREEQTEQLNKLIPTEDESFGQRALRRGLGEAPTALASPLSTLATGGRALLAGFFGEGAKELGAPEWAQTAAELTAYIGPDVTKKLLQKGSNAGIIGEARRMGLTDEQITPLIQSEFKQKWLSKLSPKRGSTQKALQDTKQGLSGIYEMFETSPISSKKIPEINNRKLVNSLNEKLNDLPRELRSKIERDVEDLLGSEVTGKSLINFWKDLNSYYGPGREKLGILKEPIKDAIKSISPVLGKDFETANALYSKYSKISSRLKPNIASDIMTAGESLGILGSLVTGNFGFLGPLMGEQALKKLSQQMLLNPRFQQLSKKSIVAMNQNKVPLLKKTIDSFISLTKKNNPEISKKLEQISDDELLELIMNK